MWQMASAPAPIEIHRLKPAGDEMKKSEEGDERAIGDDLAVPITVDVDGSSEHARNASGASGKHGIEAGEGSRVQA